MRQTRVSVAMSFGLLVFFFLLLAPQETQAKKKPKDFLKGDCLYQTISNTTTPGAVVPGARYFLTAYLAAPISTSLSTDIVIQIQEWGKGKKPLAAHSWNIPAAVLLKNPGTWVRVGVGTDDDLMEFTSSTDADLETFTVEVGFDTGAKKGESFALDAVQLEQALRLPSGNLADRPVAWVSEKGVVSPSENADLGNASRYYTW